MSAPTPTVQSPSGTVPEQAIAFGAAGTPAIPVDAANPLPVAPTLTAPRSTPLAGTATVSGRVGPFVPDLGRPIWLTLAGTWSGSVQLLRSLDGGATTAPLTAGGQGWARFTAACNEPVAEETVAAASYYLAITLASGSLVYRVQQ